MKIHWIVLAAGAVLLLAAAGIRSGQRIQATPTPPSTPQAPAIVAAPARPSLWAQINDALEAWEEASADVDSLVLPPDIPESAVVTGDLIACPKDDLQGALVQTWVDWRRQALAALPESLRNDSDHRRAIDDTYRQAIRGFLNEEVAASYDPEQVVDIINRPPVGGYDIARIGFTDIDERSEGYVTQEQAQAIVYDLRATGPNQTTTLLRFTPTWLNDRQLIVESLNGAAPDPPLDPQVQMQAQWADWKKQAIAALPENLRESSEYQAAIEATYQAAIASLGGTPHPSAPASVGVSKMD